VVTDEIDAYFNRAAKALQFNRTLAGRIELAMLATNRGQAAFFDGDFDACGFWLDSAESLYRILEIKSELAFLKTHQALVLIDRGRQVGCGSYDIAYEYLLEALQLFQVSGIREQTWNTYFLLGLSQYEASRWEDLNSNARTIRLERAREHFEDARSEVDRLRGASGGSGSTDSVYGARAASSISKVKLYRTGLQFAMDGLGDSAYALQWLERMKSRALLDAFALDTLPVPPELESDPNIVFDVQLRSRRTTTVSPEEVRALERQIDANLDILNQNAATRRYVGLRRNDVATFEEARESLSRIGAESSLLVCYFVSDGAVLAFGIRPDWPSPKVQRLDVNLDSLLAVAAEMSRPDGPLDILQDHSEAPWQALTGLVQPIQEWSAPGEHVCLIPHSCLHGLPLHTLLVGNPPQRLVWRNPVSYSPSLSILCRLLTRPKTEPTDRFLGLTAFGDSLQDRPAAAREALRVAHSTGGVALTGPSVSLEAVQAAFRNANWLHFAGHGKSVASDGLSSYLVLANDRHLTAREIMSEKIASKVVVLSGCETAAAALEAGDESVGLPLAMLYRGVSTLIASQWRVGDSSSESFMAAFYDHLLRHPLQSKLDAWQAAIQNVARNPRWENPYHWGPFVLFGDWR
jgi:CHAT domain-containing protein